MATDWEFIELRGGVRYERVKHGFEVGDAVTAVVDGRRIYGRVRGFESYEGSGLCTVNARLQIECGGIRTETHVVGYGAVQRIGSAASESTGQSKK